MCEMRGRLNPSNSYFWREIPCTEIFGWSETLLRTSGGYHQHPFWTEPYRRMGIRPVYLGYGDSEVLTAYACIQSIGLPGFRLGIVVNGPVNLQSDVPVDERVLRSLTTWAKRAGYVFVKFSHRDAGFLGRVASLSNAEPVNAFPFFGGMNDELVVELRENEDEMLASFQSIARYEIRAALRAEYEIRVSDSPRDFAQIWPMIERLSVRRGFRVYRPLAGWLDMIERASAQKCARIYSAHLASKTMQAILVVRDARTAEYMLGALDVDALGGNPSPACLLHWRAMRDAFALGCVAYALGTPSGKVFQFKRKFRPAHLLATEPVTVVTSRIRYWLWSKVILRTALPMWPRFRAMLSQALGRSCWPSGKPCDVRLAADGASARVPLPAGELAAARRAA